jgi:uncharacterized protein YecE (DUF72 family)
MWASIMLSPGGYLACYAGLFPTVELDFAFYAMPKPENLAKMLVEGGPGLTFSMSLRGAELRGIFSVALV